MANRCAEKIKVGLVQINNSYSGQSYLPYSVGLLQAYVQQYASDPARYEFLMPLYNRQPVVDSVAHLRSAQVAAFSLYVWNACLSLAIAKELKAQSPKTLIIVGGPQVPDEAEAFLRENPFVDIAVHGEGEMPFLAILEQLETRNWDTLSSASFLRPDGTFVNRPRTQRLQDLTPLPSPYLAGVFTPLIEQNPQEKWLAVWETNRGCPFSCAYCDWGSATQSRVYTFSLERLYQEIEWFADLKVPFIFCADANFGMLNRDYEIGQKMVEVRERTGFPHTLSIQSTKNATEKAYNIQKLLADSGLNKSITISFQSMDATTLENINRKNISSKSYRELQRRFTRDGIPTYTDIILGLPGETYETFANGVSQVIEDGQTNRITFNNLSILPNAEMGKLAYQEKFKLETIENEVVYIRGSIHQNSMDIPELQRLVVATYSLNKEDWVRTRAFAWMTNFVFYSKLLQLPLLLLQHTFGVKPRAVIELFADLADSDSTEFPVLHEAHRFFREKARAIQGGDYEFCPSEEFLGIFWPADELLLMRLGKDGKLPAFYREAEQLLARYLAEQGIALPSRLLHEAIAFNQNLLRQPFLEENMVFTAHFNLWEYYQAALVGSLIPLEEGLRQYGIDRSTKQWHSWDQWCREVVWWGNKSGAYLYRVSAAEPRLPALAHSIGIESQLAGHT